MLGTQTEWVRPETASSCSMQSKPSMQPPFEHSVAQKSPSFCDRQSPPPMPQSLASSQGLQRDGGGGRQMLTASGPPAPSVRHCQSFMGSHEEKSAISQLRVHRGPSVVLTHCRLLSQRGSAPSAQGSPKPGRSEVSGGGSLGSSVGSSVGGGMLSGFSPQNPSLQTKSPAQSESCVQSPAPSPGLLPPQLISSSAIAHAPIRPLFRHINRMFPSCYPITKKNCASSRMHTCT